MFNSLRPLLCGYVRPVSSSVIDLYDRVGTILRVIAFHYSPSLSTPADKVHPCRTIVH